MKVQAIIHIFEKIYKGTKNLAILNLSKMKNKIVALSASLLLALTFAANAQWPGNFYAFHLEDSSGHVIDARNHAYKMSAIQSDSFIVVGIEHCKDSTLWRFSEGGNHYMGTTQKLKIEKIVKEEMSEVMIIEFPPSLSGGKDKYYRDLYAGTLKFRKGTYKITLPQTDGQWDRLKELKLCPNDYSNNSFFDISEYQK